ncbi:MAG: hypothetical protein C4554_00170 [Dethiobacter sp.]|jgi:hypothetical protein|nr:MAG: hypothetical protein C4554_00170 [Dethiobacter sp.]
MKCHLELMKTEIAAIVPASHTEGGEATLLINVDGNKYLDRRSTGWIIKRLARLYNMDLQAVKENYGPLLGRKRYIPVPFSTRLIYLPLTLKTDTFPIDQKLGYISLEQIQGIKKENSGSILILKNGLELSCFNTLATIQSRLRESRLLQKILKSELQQEHSFYYAPEGASYAAEKTCSEEIARLTAAFLCFWKKSRK